MPRDALRATALSEALDLAQAPRLSAHMRRRPLPRDIVTLIRLAAGCRETLADASASTRREPDFLVTAAELYLRQVVCFPGADPYRVLGVSGPSPRAQMRQHMRELVLWLHPDRNARGGDRALMQRVLDAWQTVGASKADRPGRPISARQHRSRSYRPTWISRPLPKAKPRPWLGVRARIALQLALVAAGLVIPCILALGGLSDVADRLTRDRPDAVSARAASHEMLPRSRSVWRFKTAGAWIRAG